MKSTKLYSNDSLSLLYILSSSVYTFLLLFLLIFFLLQAQKTITHSLYIFFFIFVCYFLYVINSRNYVIVFLQISSINSTLQNGLLNIHPLFIYYMYANIIYIWVKLYGCRINNYFNVSYSSRLYLISFMSLFGIYLGALWASQELNWGGFWSWDPVEIISLLGILFIIKLLHNQTSYIINKKIFIYIVIAWIVYITIRLGAVTTIHSFIRSSNKMLYINISILYIFIYFSFSILGFLIYSYIFIAHQYFNKCNYKVQITILFLYTQIYIIYLLVSNSFLITLLNISTFFIIFFLYIILYLILYNKIKYIFCFIIVTLNMLIFIYFCTANISVAIMLLLYIFLSNYIISYSTKHLYFLFIYLVYFIFMINTPFYSYITNSYYYTVALTKSYFSNGPYSFYETNFFLQKHIFLNKLKNFLIHINGFTIYNNGPVSLYILTKNFVVNYLFSIEFINNTFFIIFIIIIFFIKITFIYNKHKFNLLIY